MSKRQDAINEALWEMFAAPLEQESAGDSVPRVTLADIEEEDRG